MVAFARAAGQVPLKVRDLLMVCTRGLSDSCIPPLLEEGVMSLSLLGWFQKFS
jgi:hypothetical protein